METSSLFQIFRNLSAAGNIYYVGANSFRHISFFNLSFSASNLAAVKRSRSISVRLLLVFNAAKRLPGCFLGRKAASPFIINSFTQRQSMLLSAEYAFDKAPNDICSNMFMNNFRFLFRCPNAFLLSFFRLYHLSAILTTKRKSRQMVFHLSAFSLHFQLSRGFFYTISPCMLHYRLTDAVKEMLNI